MNLDHDRIWLSRNRWTVYMAPLLVAAAAICFFRAWHTQQWQWIFAPITILPMWLMLRLTTPPKGMRVKTIRSTPGAIVLLGFATATLIMLALVVAIDIYIFGHPLRAPLQPYHTVLFAPPVITLITGALWVNQIQRNHKATASQNVSESSNRT